tara:strand:+ start:93 stop:362 length:270 start_codon:yes stop_codon:yes gene_type:complete
MSLPKIIKHQCFNSFCFLNQSERAVIMMGNDAYRESLDLENDDAPCWKLPSKESKGFVGWNPQCVPTIEYILWKLEKIKEDGYGSGWPV